MMLLIPHRPGFVASVILRPLRTHARKSTTAPLLQGSGMPAENSLDGDTGVGAVDAPSWALPSVKPMMPTAIRTIAAILARRLRDKNDACPTSLINGLAKGSRMAHLPKSACMNSKFEEEMLLQ
jgi:hypothetical protein